MIRDPGLGVTNLQSLVPVAPVKGQEPSVLPPRHPGHGPPLRPAWQHRRAVQQRPHLLGARLDLWGHCGSTRPAPQKVGDRAQGMDNVSPGQHWRLGTIQPRLPITLTVGHPIISHIPELRGKELALTSSKAPRQGGTHREPPPGRAGWCPPARWWPCSCTPLHPPAPRPGSAGTVPRPGPACGHPPNSPKSPRQQLPQASPPPGV